MSDPNNLLLSGSWGDAFGLYGVKSTISRFGVFAASTQDLHVMFPPDPVVHTDSGSFNEAAYFCRYMVECDVELIEFLWQHHDGFDVLTEAGEELLDHRSIFLSASGVRKSFLREAEFYIDLMDVRLGDFSPEAKARTSDAAQHLLRVCWQGFHLYRTGYLPQTVDEPKRFLAFGQRVADGNIDEARGVLAEYAQKFAATKSALPETADTELIDRWLRFVRLKFL